MNIINKIHTFFEPKICSECLKYVGWHIGEKYIKFDGYIYCDSCARSKFNVCDYCNLIVDASVDVVDNKNICGDCFNNKTSCCEECGVRKFTHTLNWINSEKVCDTCYKLLDRRFHTINISQTKEPSKTFVKNNNRGYCGIEIECLNSNNNKNCFIRKELKEFRFSQGVDGSLDSGGVEFRSVPMNGDLLFNSIEDFCDTLNKKDYEVNKSCGLHIHLEVKHQLEFLKKLYLFYLKFEPFFFNMLPKSRQSTGYCEKFKRYYRDSPEDIMNTKNLDDFKMMLYETRFYNSRIRCHNNGKRYCWANLHSIFYRNTLEIRSHSGTINSIKIINWIMIHQRVLKFICEKSLKEIATMKVTKSAFLNIFSKPLQNYIRKRWKVFIKAEEKELKVRSPCYIFKGKLLNSSTKQN